MAKTLEIAGLELPGRSAVHRPTSGTLQWRKVAHRLSMVHAYAILLSGLGLSAMHVTGNRLFRTLGDSMEPASSSGSLLIARLTAPEDIRVNDFIVFPEASQTRRLIGHRVVLVVKDGEQPVAITQGDNNPVFDPDPVTLDRPVARAFLVIPRVGWLMSLAIVWFLLAAIALLGLRIAWPWLAQQQPTTVLEAIAARTHGVFGAQGMRFSKGLDVVSVHHE